LILLAAGGPAFAWTDLTRRRMLDDAVKLTPPALRAVLERYRGDLVDGMLDPSRAESGEDHRQREGGYGHAARTIGLRCEQAQTLVGKPGRLGLAVYALGNAAHFAADVNFPLNTGGDGRTDPVFYAAYQRYVETTLGRFPVVLNREDSPELRESRLEDFGRAAARRASAFLPPIQAAYTPDGKPRSASSFDERSLPFGIASLSYSNAVNDIARVWIHVWESVGGDPSGRPFSADSPRPPGNAGKAREDGRRKRPAAGAAERPR
jgi:hypothetical protein